MQTTTAKQVEVKPNTCGFGYTVYVNGQAICIAHTLEQANRMAGL